MFSRRRPTHSAATQSSYAPHAAQGSAVNIPRADRQRISTYVHPEDQRPSTAGHGASEGHRATTAGAHGHRHGQHHAEHAATTAAATAGAPVTLGVLRSAAGHSLRQHGHVTMGYVEECDLEEDVGASYCQGERSNADKVERESRENPAVAKGRKESSRLVYKGPEEVSNAFIIISRTFWNRDHSTA